MNLEREFRRPQIVLTKNLRIPNEYTMALDGECRAFAFNEERALENQGRWRSDIFQVPASAALDLEVGTGNGTFFHRHCLLNPERNVVGIELKYKPLIQTIRRNMKAGISNGRVMRIHAFNVDQTFSEGEVNDIYIHFPDPWTSPRKPKNRILNERMLLMFWKLQRPGSMLFFKTDSQEAFDWSLEQVRDSRYNLEYVSRDLHAESGSASSFKTQFESIFTRQGLPIYAMRLRR